MEGSGPTQHVRGVRVIGKSIYPLEPEEKRPMYRVVYYGGVTQCAAMWRWMQRIEYQPVPL